jgi:ATP-dependent Clp protease adaptor protein ClpS
MANRKILGGSFLPMAAFLVFLCVVFFPMRPFADQDPDVLTLEEVDLDELKERKLIVLNDDFNTFEFVIGTLMKVCGHSREQAEQCTLIIHHKGKCTVKYGTYDKLLPMRDAITDRGIGAVIDE